MAGFAGVPANEKISFSFWTAEIARYISNELTDKPIIIGHSFGGALALNIAAEIPKLIESIIVVDALPCYSAFVNPAFTVKEKPDCSATVAQITNLKNDIFYQMQKMNIINLIEDETKHDMVVNWTVDSDRNTFAKMFCDFSNTDLRNKIKNISCPSLILLEAPFKAMETSIQEQYKNLKNIDMKYATKGLHFIMYDDEAWFLNQVTNFLTSK